MTNDQPCMFTAAACDARPRGSSLVQPALRMHTALAATAKGCAHTRQLSTIAQSVIIVSDMGI